MLAEALAQLRVRRVRSTLSVGLGAVAVAAFCFLGLVLAQSRAALDAAFEDARPRELWLTSLEEPGSPTADPTSSLAALERIERIPAVNSGGRFWIHMTAEVGRSPVADAVRIPVIAADPSAIDAVGSNLTRGRWPATDGILQLVASAPALTRLGLESGTALPTMVTLDGHLSAPIVGVVEPAPGSPEFSSVLYVSPEIAHSFLDPSDSATAAFVLNAEPDSLPGLAEVAPLAIRPDNPSRVSALLAPDPSRLRDLVDTNVRVALLGVGICAAILGMVSVAINSFSAVSERRMELATRLALGGRRGRLGMEVVLQNVVLGAVAGTGGAVFGTVAAAVFAANNGWPQVAIPLLTPLAVLSGVLAGGVAGLLPAIATMRVDPAAVLRSA